MKKLLVLLVISLFVGASVASASSWNNEEWFPLPRK